MYIPTIPFDSEYNTGSQAHREYLLTFNSVSFVFHKSLRE
jgi:hypothetical protein